jgi:hypothetical protein
MRSSAQNIEKKEKKAAEMFCTSCEPASFISFTSFSPGLGKVTPGHKQIITFPGYNHGESAGNFAELSRERRDIVS